MYSTTTTTNAARGTGQMGWLPAQIARIVSSSLRRYRYRLPHVSWRMAIAMLLPTLIIAFLAGYAAYENSLYDQIEEWGVGLGAFIAKCFGIFVGMLFGAVGGYLTCLIGVQLRELLSGPQK
jgi:hypothetical protein